MHLFLVGDVSIQTESYLVTALSILLLFLSNKHKIYYQLGSVCLKYKDNRQRKCKLIWNHYLQPQTVLCICKFQSINQSNNNLLLLCVPCFILWIQIFHKIQVCWCVNKKRSFSNRPCDLRAISGIMQTGLLLQRFTVNLL